MKLWLIERPDKMTFDCGKTHFAPSYGEHESGVIRAETEQDARRIAAERFLPSDAWSHPSTTCVEITPDGEPGVIHESVIED